MSKPRYRWWGYALKVVRDYPKLVATECLSEDDQKERDAVARAIEQASAGKHGKETMELIRQVYWSGVSRRIEDVARRLYISENTAARRHHEFIRAVGRCLGVTSGRGETAKNEMHSSDE